VLARESRGAGRVIPCRALRIRDLSPTSVGRRGCRGDHPYGDAVIKFMQDAFFRFADASWRVVVIFLRHEEIFGRYTFRRAVRSLALPPANAMSTITPERVSPRTSLNGLYTQPVDALSFEAVDPVNYPPNKASQWTIDPELMSFRLMHNAIRAEATKFESLLFKLGDRALAAWEIDAIKVRDGSVPRTVAHVFLARFSRPSAASARARKRTDTRVAARSTLAARASLPRPPRRSLARTPPHPRESIPRPRAAEGDERSTTPRSRHSRTRIDRRLSLDTAVSSDFARVLTSATRARAPPSRSFVARPFSAPFASSHPSSSLPRLSLAPP
jgi:hypothetical protein